MIEVNDVDYDVTIDGFQKDTYTNLLKNDY